MLLGIDLKPFFNDKADASELENPVVVKINYSDEESRFELLDYVFTHQPGVYETLALDFEAFLEASKVTVLKTPYDLGLIAESARDLPDSLQPYILGARPLFESRGFGSLDKGFPLPGFGVCDHYEQIVALFPELRTSERKFVIVLVPLFKDFSSCNEKRWSWSSGGPYIGLFTPQKEYLCEEQGIDRVFSYEIWELT